MTTQNNTAAADQINTIEVRERLDWRPAGAIQAPSSATLSIDAGALEFKATGPYQVALLANLGHQLLQEISAYRPDFVWTASPAEIIGALIEEIVVPPTGAGASFARQLIESGAANYIGEVFDTEHGDVEVIARYIAGKTPADRVMELETALAHATGEASPTDAEIIDFLEHAGSVNFDFDSCTIRIDIPEDFEHGSVREIVAAAISAHEGAA